MPAIVVWDWNGTLLDDVDLCLQVMNGMLTRRGRAPLPSVQAYRRIFCFPVQDYYRAVGFDFDREPFADLAAEYMAAYLGQVAGCPLRAEMAGAVETLAAQGVRQVVLSASRRDHLQGQIGPFAIRRHFEALLGIDDFYAAGKVQLAQAWQAQSRLNLTDAWMIGDTDHDAQVARTLGCRCLLVEGGHQDRRRLEATGARVVGPEELLTALKEPLSF